MHYMDDVESEIVYNGTCARWHLTTTAEEKSDLQY